MESHQVHNQRPQAPSNQSPAPLPAPSPDSHPSPSGKNKDKKTILLIAILILLAVAVGALAYLLVNQEKSASRNNSQTTDMEQKDDKKAADTETKKEETATAPADKTADWGTLTNETYDISFKHPAGSEWVANVTDWALPSGQQATGSVKYLPCGPNCGWALNLRIITKGTSDDPGVTYGEKQFQGNDYYKLVSKKDVVRDGVKGIRWEYAPGDDEVATVVYYYFTEGDSAYLFDVNMNGSKTDAVDITETGEAIMETLRFDS